MNLELIKRLLSRLSVYGDINELTTCAVYDDDDECRFEINTRIDALRGSFKS